MAIETELVAGIELGGAKAIALLARGDSAASRAGFTDLCAHYALASTRHFSKHHRRGAPGKMALQSELFRRDARLHHCAVIGSRPIGPGCSGMFVSRLQCAMLILGDQPVDGGELEMAFFGLTTVRSIIAWKREHLLMPRGNGHGGKRHAVDAIVGRMAIQKIDADMFAFERRMYPAGHPV